MKTLYESIIKSNGANIQSRLKDLLTAPINDRNLKKLIEFWHKLGLDIPRYEWICISDINLVILTMNIDQKLKEMRTIGVIIL